jgi:hypothetical protein
VFFVGKRCNAKDIHKEMFPVYGGKCSSHKAVHNWIKKRDKHFAGDEEVVTEVWKWLRQQLKTSVVQVSMHLYAMGQVYQC